MFNIGGERIFYIYPKGVCVNLNRLKSMVSGRSTIGTIKRYYLYQTEFFRETEPTEYI